MALTLEASGTQSATVTTEHTLATITTAGTYVLMVDTDAMVSGDGLELRVKTKVLTGGTARVIGFARFDGEQPPDDKIKISVPWDNELAEAGALVFTLKQTTGTSRNFPWKVMEYA